MAGYAARMREAYCVLAGSRERGVVAWAGRVTCRLRLAGGELGLAGKQVLLVNRGQPLPTLAFLM